MELFLIAGATVSIALLLLVSWLNERAKENKLNRKTELWKAEVKREADARGIELRRNAEHLEKLTISYISETISRLVVVDMLASEIKSRGEESDSEIELRMGTFRHLIFIGACERCIKEHAKVLMRKRKSAIYKDDYGREMRDGWLKEIRYFVEQILIPFLKDEALRRPEIDLKAGESYQLYVEQFRPQDVEFYVTILDDFLDGLSCDEELDELPESGHDYERYVASIFEAHGYSARVTKGSGDHGADIVVDWGGGEIVVQCKHYSSPVGNKAIQEVYSAKGFYDADQAWVVASSSFTPAAKIAAQKLGVLLFHHEELPEMLEAIDSGSV